MRIKYQILNGHQKNQKQLKNSTGIFFKSRNRDNNAGIPLNFPGVNPTPSSSFIVFSLHKILQPRKLNNKCVPIDLT